jgi:hypothetical protein
VKKLILVLVAVFLLLSGVAVIQTTPVSAGTWTIVTDPANYVTWCAVRVNGSVTAMTVSSTRWGFVIGTTSHANPGNTLPPLTGYEVVTAFQTETHNSPFSEQWDNRQQSWYPFEPDTTYYYRFCAYFGSPDNTWSYGDELTFTTESAPSEECHHITGYDPTTYSCVFTDNVAYDDWGHVTFYGHVDDPWAGIETGGWVIGTESLENPDGWPYYYGDYEPTEEESGYPTFLVGPDEGHEQTEWVQDAYGISLDWGVTYYYRFCVDFVIPGDWVYGPEYSFTMPPEPDCYSWEYQSLYTPDEYGYDPICPDVWVAQNIECDYTHDFNVILLKMYRVGTPTDVELNVYLADDFTWYPVGDPLASATIDVSGLTTDVEGEWLEVDLSSRVTMTNGSVYDIAMVGVDVCGEGGDYAVWVTQDGVESEYLGGYMYTYDSGEDWQWPSRDGLFALYCCAGSSGVTATYETWGYVPSTRPVWYQAWPSILKILYIGAVLLAAMFTYRQKPKPQYPDMPDMPDMMG